MTNFYNHNTENLNVDVNSFVANIAELDEYRVYLQSIVASKNFDTKEASLLLANDEDSVNTVKKLTNVFKKDSLKYIVVVGIGGSNLGTKAIYNALRGIYEVGKVEILFIDTVSKRTFSQISARLKRIDSSEFVINVISKSGKTIETRTNFSKLYDLLSQYHDDLDSRIVVTTDEKSELYDLASEKKWHKLIIPKNVGGRYSVFSPVGLFPLSLADVDISELIKGAKDSLQANLSEEIEDNLSVSLASAIFEHAKEGRRIHNLFIFASELEDLGKWYRQLLAESLGKVADLDGNQSSFSIVPLISIGSTDLHSVAQLYLSNPKMEFTTFIKIVGNGELDDLDSLMNIICDATKNAYIAKDKPFIDIELSEISEYTLGAFIQMQMISIMYLARLMNVNAFDQPHVELYKLEICKLLEN